MQDRLCAVLLDPGLPLLVGYLFALVLGLVGTRSFVRHIEDNTQLTSPVGIPPERWKKALFLSGRAGTRLHGVLETSLFFIATWVGQVLLVSAWLAFKVASKWEVWSTIIKVPSREEKLDESGIDILEARNRWGSQLLLSHLVGTLGNLLAGLLGVALGKLVGYVLFGTPVSWLSAPGIAG